VWCFSSKENCYGTQTDLPARDWPGHPPSQAQRLRLIAGQRQKLGGMLASEKNRLHKILSDAGIRLGVLVSDIHGVVFADAEADSSSSVRDLP